MDLCFASIGENGRKICSLSISILLTYMLLYITHRIMSNHTFFRIKRWIEWIK